MVTADELEPRVRAVEEDAVGEQLVTRHILKETRQNSGDLATIRAQLTHLQGDMILANAALNNHGIRLDQLTRDVTAIRNDVTALRRGQEEIHVRLDQQDSRLDAIEGRLDRMDKRLDTMEGRLDRVDKRLDAMEGRLDRLESRLEVLDRRLDAVDGRLDRMDGRLEAIERNVVVMERNIAAILAAVAPGAPPPA